MNIVLLNNGLGDRLVVQQLRYQLRQENAPESSRINLLIVDAREMSDECFAAACNEVRAVRSRFGLNLGVLVCKQPTLPITVAAIRCGLHDVVTQYVSAAHLRDLLRIASPGVRLQQFHAVVALLRTFSGFSAAEVSARDLARREQELARKREELTELERRLLQEKETFSHREHDLRERTRRVDRQLARLQTDVDAAVAPSAAPSAELEALKRKLDQRAAELDLRERILNEMQELLSAQATDTGARS